MQRYKSLFAFAYLASSMSDMKSALRRSDIAEDRGLLMIADRDSSSADPDGF